MRLLITIPDLSIAHGGTSLCAARSADALAALGAEVAVAYGAEESAQQELRPRNAQVQLFSIGSSTSGRPQARGFVRTLLDAASEFRPQLIYDFGIWTPRNMASSRVASKLEVPWVCSPSGMLEPWPLSSKRIKKKLAWLLYQQRLLRRAAALIAASQQEKENLCRLLPAATVKVVPIGVDLPDAGQYFAAVDEPRQALYLSRLDPKKQPDLLIRTWALLRPSGWCLVIAGPGPGAYRESLQALIQSLKAADVIELRDAVYGEHKERLLFESHLFVLPTLSENFGIAIVEALAHGLPVITTTATPWAELEAARCGWIVPPTEPGLIEGLKQAFALPAGELQAMGQRGREHAERYSWQQSGLALFNTLSALLPEQD